MVIFLMGLYTQLRAQGEDAAFRNITSAEGLPTTSVTDVTQDTFGLIWIGSWDGVYRFDGKSYEKMFYTGRYVTADLKGGVWVAKQTGSLAYYDSYKDSWKEYNDLDTRRYLEVVIDGTGKVFVQTTRGLLRYNEELDTFELEEGQNGNLVFGLKMANDGRLHFISYDSARNKTSFGFRAINGKFSYEDLPRDKNDAKNEFFNVGWPIFNIPYKDEGCLIVNRNGYAIRDNDTSAWVFHKADDPDALKGLSFEGNLLKNGNLWMNQNNRLVKLHLESGKTTVFKNDATNFNSVLAGDVGQGSEIFVDRQGVLWIPKFSYGISRLNLYESDFGLLKDESGFPVRDVISAIELEDGSFWIGERTNSSKGLIHFASDRKTILERIGGKWSGSPDGKSRGKNLSHPFVWSLLKSAEGSLWAGTGSPNPETGGLNRIRPGDDMITIFRHDPADSTSLPNNWIFNLFEDGAGRIWIDSRGQLSFIDPETEEITRYEPEGISGRIGVLRTNTNGDLLMSLTEEENVLLFLVSSQDLKITKLKLGSDKELNSWNANPHQDSLGRIWFSNNDGFGYTDTRYDSFLEWYDLKEIEFPASEIEAINSDAEGKLWFGTDNGIVNFDPETKISIRFGFERGLQGNLYAGRIQYKGPSGRIYFGGTGGINVFDPAEMVTNPFPPEMVFTDIRLDGISLPVLLDSVSRMPVFTMEEISVGPETGTLTLDFAAIHFGGANSNTYEFQLEGFDNDWQNGANTGSATYTNLPAGDYNFMIRGSNLDGVWSDGSKSIRIRVLPPWYLTWWAYGVYLLLLLIGGWQLHVYLKKRTIRKERELARDRELEQAKEIEEAYTELKNTQEQLIHSEKMASLGELTAGIAHEIQNPLNFVNNFAEVSNELIDEMNEEMDKGDLEEAKAIGLDLKQNLDKINHHGKRADNIVKGMLQHSRSSDGKKEPTDINALADEYLRLAYHGLRAKDKSFNATLKTDFDAHIGKINIVSQDIGRVILNLITNAFYVVDEKKKSGAENYEPTVSVSTKKDGKHIEIEVTDNGKGIPKRVLDKIFQPFFTTKPTGQGTGLGLSLSYDIVKSHKGDLKVKTEKGKGTTFTIKLPLE
jgi:signal transduction histidine kinase/ligand-binding sensor domain-containing protein